MPLPNFRPPDRPFRSGRLRGADRRRPQCRGRRRQLRFIPDALALGTSSDRGQCDEQHRDVDRQPRGGRRIPLRLRRGARRVHRHERRQRCRRADRRRAAVAHARGGIRAADPLLAWIRDAAVRGEPVAAPLGRPALRRRLRRLGRTLPGRGVRRLLRRGHRHHDARALRGDQRDVARAHERGEELPRLRDQRRVGRAVRHRARRRVARSGRDGRRGRGGRLLRGAHRATCAAARGARLRRVRGHRDDAIFFFRR